MFESFFCFFLIFHIADDLSKLLDVHNEVLALLKGECNKWNFQILIICWIVLIFHYGNTEIKRDNEKIHKSLSLQMQVCRQEIVEHVRHLKNSVTRMVSMSTNGMHSKDDKENGLSNHQNLMDEESSNDDEDNEFHRW